MRRTIDTTCWNPKLEPRLLIDFASITNPIAFTSLCKFFQTSSAGEIAISEIVKSQVSVDEFSFSDQSAWIFISDNLCPEFMENHWDLGAAALLRTTELVLFDRVLENLRAEIRFRKVVQYDRLLTRSERNVLHAEVRGLSSEEIAESLGKSPRMVRDHLETLRDKLRARYPLWNLRKTQHFVHYYLGRWELLNEVARERQGMFNSLQSVQ
jgi:DNA-binding CsgD family transcriptional regulator